jgi:hypothetical protein
MRCFLAVFRESHTCGFWIFLLFLTVRDDRNFASETREKSIERKFKKVLESDSIACGFVCGQENSTPSASAGFLVLFYSR